MIRLCALLLGAFLASPVHAAFNFNGSDQSVNIADDAVLDNPDADWTYAFMWLMNATTGGQDRRFFSNTTALGDNPGFAFYVSNSSGPGNVVARNNPDSGTDQITTSSAQEGNTTGVWRRVIVQHTGNALTIFLDNTQIATSNVVAVASAGPAGGLYLGAFPGSVADGNGALCDIAKWSRLLTADERAALNLWSAKAFPQSQQFFIPAVREFIEIRVPLTLTNSSSTIVDCPRLFRPN
jgi:Concanavalin A-like lectin/glucanases superfamily